MLGAADGVELGLEVRHDVACEEVVGAHDAFAVGPFVGEHHQAAEAVGAVQQALDHLDRIVGRADDGGAVLDGALGRLGRVGCGRAERVAEVVDLPGAVAVTALVHRALAVVGDVHRHHQPPLPAVDGLLGLLGELLDFGPLAGEVAAPVGQVDADAEQADAVLAGDLAPRGRDGAGRGHLEVRLGVGRELEARVDQLEPVGLAVDGAVVAQQCGDRLERLVHPPALGERVDAHHRGVGGERAGADAEHRAPVGHVIELDHAVGDDQRVVVGQADDAGAEADLPGAFGRGGDEDFGRGDQLPAGGVVLADPGLVEAEPVEVLDQFEVAVQRQRGVVPDAVEGRHEDSEVHSSRSGHVAPPLLPRLL